MNMPAWLTWTAAKAFFGGAVKRGWTRLTGLNGMQLLCLALAVLLVVEHVALILSHRHSAKVEKQLAASAQALNTSRRNEATLRAAIARQNAAIADLTAKSKAQQKQAAEASQAAAERAKSAEAVSDRLKASSRSVPAPAASCEPSAALKEQWQ
jgi:hypothetical protein